MKTDKPPDLFAFEPTLKCDPWYGHVRDNAGDSQVRQVRQWIQETWEWYYGLGLNDSHFVKQFPLNFCSRWWELKVASFLNAQGFHLHSNNDGPDLICEKDGKKIYVEDVVCGPGNDESPDYVGRISDPPPAEGRLHSVKDGLERERIELLRFTTAIDAKVMQYLKFLQDGKIDPKIPYVIALCPILIPETRLDEYYIPGVLNAVYPIGGEYWAFDRDGMRSVDVGRSLRPSVLNKNESEVSTSIFHEPDSGYSGISGILYNQDDFKRFSNSINADVNNHQFVFVHNVSAINKIDIGFIGMSMDYWVQQDKDVFRIRNNIKENSN